MRIVFRFRALLHASIVCLAAVSVFPVSAQTQTWVQQDIGAPASATVWTSGGAVTTSTRGLASVSGGDEAAFSHQPVKVSGKLEWTQPGAVSWLAGRCEGIALRQTASPGSPSVFWGLKGNGSGVPKLVFQWRLVENGVSLVTEVNDVPLRFTTGELKLRLEWHGTHAVASWFKEATSEWKALYAIELGAGSEGRVLGGVLQASGAAAASWTGQVPGPEMVASSQGLLPWIKRSEPKVAGIAARVTTSGYTSVYTAPDAPEDWMAVANPALTGGDLFYHALDASSLTSVGMESISTPGGNAVDVFVRWGDVAGSTASNVVNVEVWDDLGIAFSTSINQQRDSGLWVNVGQLAAGTIFTHVYLDGPAAASGHLAFDGVLLLSKDAETDDDGDLLPDVWERYTAPGTGLHPGWDEDGDGLSNAEEWAQLRDPSFFDADIYPTVPTLTRIGPAQRKAPLGTALVQPLQVSAAYSGTSIPVVGYKVDFLKGNSPVRFSSTLEQAGVAKDLTTTTEANGVSSAYVRVDKAATQSPVDVDVAGFGSPAMVSFELLPYFNHEPGPVDLHPESATLALAGSVAAAGQVRVMGTWMAVGQPGTSGVTPGKVNLYRWESATNTWRPAYTLASPSTTPLTDGFGTDLRIGHDVLAVQAQGDQKIHLYELQAYSEYWELKASIITSGAITDFAIGNDVVAVAQSANDEVRLYKRTSPGGWQTGSPQVLAPAAPRIPEIEFGARIGFSPEGDALWIGGPAHQGSTAGELGELVIYTPGSGGTWGVNATVSGPTEAAARSFGLAARLEGDQLYVGAPVIAALAAPGDVGHVYSFEKSGASWVKQETLTGTVGDFGRHLWTLKDHLLVAWHDGIQTPVSGTAWNRVSLYRKGSSSHTLLHDVAQPSAGGDVEGDSLFLAALAPAGQIKEHRFVAQVAHTAPDGEVFGSLDLNDLDGDAFYVSLLQPDSLWSLDLTADPLLKVATGADLPAVKGTLQWFNIRLSDLAGSLYEESFLVKVAGELPAAPSSLTAAVTGIKAVRLDWLHDGSGSPSFRVERASITKNTSPTGSETYQSVALAQGWARFHVDETVTALQDYAYRVRAEGAEGNSSYSNVAVLHWDQDNDGMPDWWEAAHGGDLLPGDDADGDGRTNLQEYTGTSNPLLADTDGDGTPDGTDTQVNDRNTNAAGLQIFTVLSKP